MKKNIMKFSIPLLSLFFIALLTGCSTVSVNYDYDNTVNFATIHTYTWGEIPGVDDTLTRDPLLRKRFIASIDNYLQLQGYQKADPALADVLIVIQAGVDEKMRIIDWGYPGGYYGYPHGWYLGGYGTHSAYGGFGYAYGSRIDVSYYEEGTLVVDIVDNAKKQLVWRGVGTGIIQRYASHAELQEVVDEYVQKIFHHFPPGNEKTVR